MELASQAYFGLVNPRTKSARQPCSVGRMNASPNYKIKTTCQGHKRAISSVKFAPNGELLASASELVVSLCFLVWHLTI